MTRWRRTLLPSLALVMPLLAACAQAPSLDQRLSTLIGVSEGDLVARLGVPVRVHEADGRRFLEFERRSAVAVAQPPVPVYGFGFGPWVGYPGFWLPPPPPAVAQVSCYETFTLREGRVTGFSYRGDGC